MIVQWPIWVMKTKANDSQMTRFTDHDYYRNGYPTLSCAGDPLVTITHRFPEDEAAWMVCEAWNRGITQQTDSRDVTIGSRDLCSLALEVTQELPSYKAVYSRHMVGLLGRQDTVES